MRSLFTFVALFSVLSVNVMADGNGDHTALLRKTMGDGIPVYSLANERGVKYALKSAEDKMIPDVIYAWDIVNDFEDGDVVEWHIQYYQQDGSFVEVDYTGKVRYVQIVFGTYIYIDYHWSQTVTPPSGEPPI